MFKRNSFHFHQILLISRILRRKSLRKKVLIRKRVRRERKPVMSLWTRMRRRPSIV